MTATEREPGSPLKTSAITCLVQGFTHLRLPAVRSLVLIPLLINCALYAGALWVSVHYFGMFLQSILPQWLGFLQWVLWPIFGLVFLFLVSFTFTLAANILGAPFYGVLAERLLAAAGVPAGSRGGNALRSAAQSMWIEARRVAGYLLRAVPFLLLFVVPGVNVAAPFLWLAFSAWFLAQDYFSYPFDALGLPYAEQQQNLRRMRVDRFVFGGLVQLALSIPVLNILVSPAAVAGATLYAAARFKPGEPRRVTAP